MSASSFQYRITVYFHDGQPDEEVVVLVYDMDDGILSYKDPKTGMYVSTTLPFHVRQEAAP